MSVQCPSIVSMPLGLRIVVGSLSRQDLPVVEALRISSKMPLPCDRCSITGLSEQFGKCLLVTIEPVSVPHKAIEVTVLSGLNNGSTWTTDTVGTEAVLEQHPLGCQSIDIRCRIHFFQPAVVGPNGMRSVIIGEDKHDIWAIGSQS